MTEEREKLLRSKGMAVLLHNSFSLTLNANDFFQRNDCYAIDLEEENFHWAAPIAEKYGIDGVNAILSFIRKQMPIPHYQTEKFKEALAELEALNPEIYEP